MHDDFSDYRLYLMEELKRNTNEHACIRAKMDLIDSKLTTVLTRLKTKDNKFKFYIALMAMGTSIVTALITALVVS